MEDSSPPQPQTQNQPQPQLQSQSQPQPQPQSQSQRQPSLQPQPHSSKGKGRKKIEMKKMDKESNLSVTFTKRRTGLFKKASELCILCGIEIATIVFSPSKKVFSFGHPSIDTIIDRYLIENPTPNSTTSRLLKAYRTTNINRLNKQLTDLLTQIEVEKKKQEEIREIRKAREDQNLWWEAPIENLELEQLQQLDAALHTLRKNLVKYSKRVVAETTNPLPVVPICGSIGGDGGSSSREGESSSGHHLIQTPLYRSFGEGGELSSRHGESSSGHRLILTPNGFVLMR